MSVGETPTRQRIDRSDGSPKETESFVGGRNQR